MPVQRAARHPASLVAITPLEAMSLSAGRRVRATRHPWTYAPPQPSAAPSEEPSGRDRRLKRSSAEEAAGAVTSGRTKGESLWPTGPPWLHGASDGSPAWATPWRIHLRQTVGLGLSPKKGQPCPRGAGRGALVSGRLGIPERNPRRTPRVHECNGATYPSRLRKFGTRGNIS